MKKKSSKKTVLCFYILDIILAAIIFLSVFLAKEKSSRDTQISAILNPKYTGKINVIKITDKNDNKSIFLKKNDWSWVISDKLTNGNYSIPCDYNKVSIFLTNVSRIHTMKKLTTSRSFWKNYNVDTDNGMSVTFIAEENGHKLLDQTIFFGMEDNLRSTVAFRADGQETVWESSVETASLNADSFYWADPFIYPEFITGQNTSTERILRHGKLNFESIDSISELPYTRITRRFSNGNRAVIDLYERDSVYIAIPHFYAYNSDNLQSFLDSLNYKFEISSLTLSNLIKESKEN